MQDAADARSPLTSGDVARLFNVHPTTVLDWADKGLLAFFRTPGGHRRFRAEDVDAFLAVPVCDCDEPEVDGIGMCSICKRKPRDLLRRPA